MARRSVCFSSTSVDALRQLSESTASRLAFFRLSPNCEAANFQRCIVAATLHQPLSARAMSSAAPSWTSSSLAPTQVPFFSLFENQAPMSSRTPIHVHANDDETFYMLEGEMTAVIDGEKVILRPGDSIFLRRNIPHQLLNKSNMPARYLLLCTPSGFKDFLADGGWLLQPGSDPKPTSGADAPNAAITVWDGVGFSDAHSSGCTSDIARLPDGTYRVSTACTALGDGTPNSTGAPFKDTMTLKRLSSTKFVLTKAKGVKTKYRWCGAR